MKKRIISLSLVLILALTAAVVPAAAAGCCVSVNYNLQEQGVSADMLAESVASDAQPAHVPTVVPLQENMRFVGWTLTDPKTLAEGETPELVDPTSIRVQEDTTFYAVFEEVIPQPVPESHTHYVIGYPDGRFGPEDPINRASVATIIARAILPNFVEGKDYGNPARYSDVEGHWAASAIAYCTLYNVFKGYSDGSFQPDKPITRQEFALVMARLNEDGVLTMDEPPFSDMDDADDWAKDGIYTAYVKEWVNGYTDGTFKPQNNIRRDEAVSIFNRFLNRGVDAEGLSGMKEYVFGSGDVDNATYLTWPDVPETQWAYYHIIEAANDHEYFYTGEDEASLPEKWVSSTIEESTLARVDAVGYARLPVVEKVSYENDGRTVPAIVTLPRNAEGAVPAVVLAHGHGGSKDENVGFGGVAKALARAGIASIRMDFPGCGDSTESFQKNTMSNMISDTLAGVNYLTENYDVDADNLGILGYSMGGRIASQIVGSDSNPFKAVVLLSAADGAVPGDLTVNLFGSKEKYDELKEKAGKDGYAVFTTIYGQVQELSKEWFADMESGKPLSDLAKFTGPVLVLHGDQDTMITDKMNQDNLAACQNGSEIIVPDADHGYGFYSDQPEVTALVEGSVAKFFAQHLAGQKPQEGVVTGTVTEVEKYGHGLLDVKIADFLAAGFDLGDIVTVSAGSYTGDMPFFDGYYVEKGEYMLRAYPTHEYIAVCINYGKFCETAGIDVGDTVTISLKEKAGALTTQTVYALKYTKDRADYASDEVFANFREVKMGGIMAGRLYRSASPINNENGRASYADDLIEKAGVMTVLNLADTEEELDKYLEAEDFDSPYYKSLMEEGNVIALGMPVNFSSDEFAEGIVKGLVFLSEHGGPYLVHCTEGKDRAGFTMVLLEALMGATQEEIIEDYMISYENYYGVVKGDGKYDLIVAGNVMEMFRAIAGLEKGASLDEVDLAQATLDYLTSHGMEENAIAALKANLK